MLAENIAEETGADAETATAEATEVAAEIVDATIEKLAADFFVKVSDGL